MIFFLPKHLQVFYVCFFLERMYTDVLINVLNEKKSTNLTPVFLELYAAYLVKILKRVEVTEDLMKSTGGLFSFGALGGGSVRYPPGNWLTCTLLKALLKMIFLFPRWYMLVSWKVMWLTKSLRLFDEASDSHQAQRQCCTMITRTPQPTIAHAKVGSGRCAGQIADCGEGTTKSWNWMEIP